MTGFLANCVDCEVYYKPGIFDHDVERLEIKHNETRRFKSVDDYIKGFIDDMKHNVIKRLPNLSLVEIHMGIFDKGNIIHRLIVTVANMLQDILKYKNRICFKKSVFVMITYEGKIVFTGNLSFSGLK